MSEPFGFVVARTPKTIDEHGGIQRGADHWAVFLPHQCDCWDIAGESYPWGPHYGVPHEEAVAQLKGFIVEAHAALASLQTRQEIGDKQEAS